MRPTDVVLVYFWIYFDFACFATAVLVPLERSFIVIVGGFLGVTNLSSFTCLLGLAPLDGSFLTGVARFGVIFFRVATRLGDLALIGVEIFLIGVAIFFIYLDLVDLAMSVASKCTGV